MRLKDEGLAITVAGPVPPDALAYTLSHEHLFLTLQQVVNPHPDPDIAKELAGPIRMEMLGYLRRYWRWNHANNLLDDPEPAIDEVRRFARLGGLTICDVTPIGTRVPDQPAKLRRVAEAAGVNIVMGTAQYTAAYHEASVATSSTEDVAAVFTAEIVEGAGPERVRAGVIGEIGLSHPVHRDEAKVLDAAAMAHLGTGAAISIHKEIDDPVPFWALDRLEALGVSLDRVVLGHVGDNVPVEPIIAAMRRGVFVAVDNFGIEGYFDNIEFPTDGDTVRKVARLIEAGFAGQVLLSQDVCHKHMLRRFGGYGYDHIQRDIRPMLTRAGVSDAAYQQMMVENPRRLLPLRRGVGGGT